MDDEGLFRCVDTPFGLLPDETLQELCYNMDIESLQNFVESSRRQYNVCEEILEYKIAQDKRNMLRGAIGRALYDLPRDKVLDISNIGVTGAGIKTIPTPDPRSSLRRVSDKYRIYVTPERYDEMVEVVAN